jgi:hypothetical protein
MQESMFLRDLEQNANPPGSYAEVIEAMRHSGAEIEQILHLFTERSKHLERFTQDVMRCPSPLSPGFRELIAALVSSRNQCPF